MGEGIRISPGYTTQGAEGSAPLEVGAVVDAVFDAGDVFLDGASKPLKEVASLGKWAVVGLVAVAVVVLFK